LFTDENLVVYLIAPVCEAASRSVALSGIRLHLYRQEADGRARMQQAPEPPARQAARGYRRSLAITGAYPQGDIQALQSVRLCPE